MLLLIAGDVVGLWQWRLVCLVRHSKGRRLQESNKFKQLITIDSMRVVKLVTLVSDFQEYFIWSVPEIQMTDQILCSNFSPSNIVPACAGEKF